MKTSRAMIIERLPLRKSGGEMEGDRYCTVEGLRSSSWMEVGKMLAVKSIAGHYYICYTSEYIYIIYMRPYIHRYINYDLV